MYKERFKMGRGAMCVEHRSVYFRLNKYMKFVEESGNEPVFEEPMEILFG